VREPINNSDRNLSLHRSETVRLQLQAEREDIVATCSEDNCSQPFYPTRPLPKGIGYRKSRTIHFQSGSTSTPMIDRLKVMPPSSDLAVSHQFVSDRRMNCTRAMWDKVRSPIGIDITTQVVVSPACFNEDENPCARPPTAFDCYLRRTSALATKLGIQHRLEGRVGIETLRQNLQPPPTLNATSSDSPMCKPRAYLAPHTATGVPGAPRVEPTQHQANSSLLASHHAKRYPRPRCNWYKKLLRR